MQSEELIERVLAFVPAIYLMGECLYSYTKSRVRGLVFHVCFWGGYLGLIFDYGIFALIIYCMIYHLISVGQVLELAVVLSVSLPVFDYLYVKAKIINANYCYQYLGISFSKDYEWWLICKKIIPWLELIIILIILWGIFNFNVENMESPISRNWYKII